MTLKFDGWPSKTIGHLFYATSSFVHHFVAALVNSNWSYSPEAPNLGQIRRFLAACDLGIWRMTFKNNRTPLLCYFKLCAPLRSGIGEFKLELQSGNAQSGWNSTIFSTVWPWNLRADLEKQKGTSPKQHQAICIISSSYVKSNWSYSPETVKLGCDLYDFDLWSLTLTFCMDLTLVLGDSSWKFHDDMMMGT